MLITVSFIIQLTETYNTIFWAPEFLFCCRCTMVWQTFSKTTEATSNRAMTINFWAISLHSQKVIAILSWSQTMAVAAPTFHVEQLPTACSVVTRTIETDRFKCRGVSKSGTVGIWIAKIWITNFYLFAIQMLANSSFFKPWPEYRTKSSLFKTWSE